MLQFSSAVGVAFGETALIRAFYRILFLMLSDKTGGETSDVLIGICHDALEGKGSFCAQAVLALSVT